MAIIWHYLWFLFFWWRVLKHPKPSFILSQIADSALLTPYQRRQCCCGFWNRGGRCRGVGRRALPPTASPAHSHSYSHPRNSFYLYYQMISLAIPRMCCVISSDLLLDYASSYLCLFLFCRLLCTSPNFSWVLENDSILVDAIVVCYQCYQKIMKA